VPLFSAGTFPGRAGHTALMGWVWRVATGVEWDEAVPALRAYWQSHRALLRSLFGALGAVTVGGALLQYWCQPRIVTPLFLRVQQYFGEGYLGYGHRFSTPATILFVMFLGYCFVALPLTAQYPTEIKAATLLPQRCSLILLAVAAGFCNGALLCVQNIVRDQAFEGSTLFFILTGMAAILIPALCLLGIQHRQLQLSRAVRFCLGLWLLATFCVDWLAWIPFESGLTYDGSPPFQGLPGLAYSWALPLLILLLFSWPRARTVAFALSIVGFTVITLCSVTLLPILGQVRPVILEHAGLIGLGRVDPTVMWSVIFIR
jgi:hypothetical protein